MDTIKLSCGKRAWNWLRQLIPFGIWGGCLLILVALLFGAVFGFFGRDPARRAPADSWAPVEERLWGPLLRQVGFDRAITLIETKVPAGLKEQALRELLDQTSVAQNLLQTPAPSPPAPAGQEWPVAPSADEEQAYLKKYEETKRQDDEKRLGQLKRIHQALDKLDNSPAVLNGYAILGNAYSTVGAKAESEKAFQQLDGKIQDIGGIVEQLKDWFMPLFRDRIALLACGIMAFAVFFLKPTVEVQAKAFSFWFHSRNPGPNIQKALGNKPPEGQKIVLP